MMIDKWYMINANAWRFHGEVFCMFWGAEAAEAVAGAWESPGRQGMPVEASGVGRKFFSNSRMQWGLSPRKVSGSQEREGSESLNVPKVPRYWIVLEPGSGFGRFRRFLGVLEGWGVRGGVMITFLKVTHMLEASSTTEVIAWKIWQLMPNLPTNGTPPLLLGIPPELTFWSNGNAHVHRFRGQHPNSTRSMSRSCPHYFRLVEGTRGWLNQTDPLKETGKHPQCDVFVWELFGPGISFDLLLLQIHLLQSLAL